MSSFQTTSSGHRITHQFTAATSAVRPPHTTVAPAAAESVPHRHDGASVLTGRQRRLIGVVVTGAVVIAGIGFAGSYAAVRELALKKGFGDFSYVFPIGIDAGICVLLALDLLLTWIRIPFPLLRQTAWLLTAATIAFNGAAAWPDPLGVGMHAVIPILFVVAVEAARHATGRIADITADKHMEGVRLTRWLLSPVPTFLLWRRMRLWELRSYDQVIKLEQERLVYQAGLRSRYGRAWRRKAPVESLMPLRLAKYGVPLAETAPAGLAAAGIEPALQASAPAPDPATNQPVADAPADHLGTAGITAARTQSSAPGTSGATALHSEQRLPSTPRIPDQPQHRQNPPQEANAHFTDPHQQTLLHETGHARSDPQEQHDQSHEDRAHQPDEHPSIARNAAALSPGKEDPASPGERPRPHTPTTTEPQTTTTTPADPSHSGPLQPTTPPQQTARQTPTHNNYLAGIGISDKSTVITQPVTNEEQPQPTEKPEKHHDGFIQQHDTCTAREHEHTTPPTASAHIPPTEQSPEPRPHEEPHPHTPDLTSHQNHETPQARQLTPVDHYYLAWHDFQQQHGKEPDGTELSAHLARRGILDPKSQPVKPKALARYFHKFRIYTTWAQHRATTLTPPLDQIIEDLAQRGITAQYNKPLRTPDLAKHLPDFERRWQTLTHHTATTHPAQAAARTSSASS
ncbi:DUF2637 domain-containing protein [Streptomyces sp. NPDC002845]